MDLEKDIREICNQYFSIITEEILGKKCSIIPRDEVKKIVICVNELIQSHVFEHLIPDQLQLVLINDEGTQARSAFNQIADQVLAKESWGRVIALFAFSHEVIKLCILHDKSNRISEVKSWLEQSLLKHKCWFKKHGWETFIIRKNIQSKFSIVIAVSFLCIFVFSLFMK